MKRTEMNPASVENHLSKDENLPDKIKLSIIKQFNRTKKSSTVAKLIKDCEEMEQGLVLKDAFIRARDTLECPGCGKAVGNELGLSDSKCSDCLKKEQAEKAKKVLNGKWLDLCGKLFKLDKSYKLAKSKQYGENTIKRAVKLDNGDEINFTIYRDNMWSGSTWHSRRTGHALRITSDHVRLRADKLKRDFDKSGVAKALHDRINKMVGEQNLRTERVKERSTKSNQFNAMIKKELSTKDENMSDHFIRYGRGRSALSTTTKHVDIGGTELLATMGYRNDKEIIYTVKRLKRSFNAAQIKKLLAFIDKL